MKDSLLMQIRSINDRATTDSNSISLRVIKLISDTLSSEELDINTVDTVRALDILIGVAGNMRTNILSDLETSTSPIEEGEKIIYNEDFLKDTTLAIEGGSGFIQNIMGKDD